MEFVNKISKGFKFYYLIQHVFNMARSRANQINPKILRQ